MTRFSAANMQEAREQFISMQHKCERLQAELETTRGERNRLSVDIEFLLPQVEYAETVDKKLQDVEKRLQDALAREKLLILKLRTMDEVTQRQTTQDETVALLQQKPNIKTSVDHIADCDESMPSTFRRETAQFAALYSAGIKPVKVASENVEEEEESCDATVETGSLLEQKHNDKAGACHHRREAKLASMKQTKARCKERAQSNLRLAGSSSTLVNAGDINEARTARCFPLIPFEKRSVAKAEKDEEESEVFKSQASDAKVVRGHDLAKNEDACTIKAIHEELVRMSADFKSLQKRMRQLQREWDYLKEKLDKSCDVILASSGHLT